VVYGNALLANSDTKTAIEEYKMAIGQRADYENAYYNLARALRQDGQTLEAKVVLSQALDLDPEDVRVLKMLDELSNDGSIPGPGGAAGKAAAKSSVPLK
jgi:tetratricopeptide (TPR) repeat protein